MICHQRCEWCEHVISLTGNSVWNSAWLSTLGEHFKNVYELWYMRALKFSTVCKNHFFPCMGKIFFVEFQRYPLKFHTKYLTHTSDWKMCRSPRSPRFMSSLTHCGLVTPYGDIDLTLIHVMACCLMAPSRYLNQCWLIINKVQWHSSEGNFAKDISATNHKK